MSNGLCMVNRSEMTEQEWESYTAHLEKRNQEEQQKLTLEKERIRAYKASLILDILERRKGYSLEDLQRMSIRTLERIFDYV